MKITNAIPQLRTTDLGASIRFYTTTLGPTLACDHQDFYAGILVGDRVVHLKLVDNPNG